MLPAAVVLVVGVAVGAFLVASAGRFDTVARASGRPGWADACRVRSPDDRMCARVVGRVLWVQEVDDDGDGDRHLLVVARRDVHIVKLPRQLPLPELPGLGSRVRAVGYLTTGASGRTEVRAERLDATGRVLRRPVSRGR